MDAATRRNTAAPNLLVNGGDGIATKIPPHNLGEVIDAIVAYIADLMIVTENGILIRTHVDGISTMGRNTQGVGVISLKDGDAIADVTRVVTEVDDEEALAGTTNGTAPTPQEAET